MATAAQLRKLALALPETEEKSHFGTKWPSTILEHRAKRGDLTGRTEGRKIEWDFQTSLWICVTENRARSLSG
jgi:hypothetical protein